MTGDTPNTGIVYLVGAGPGDPGLLTVKGLQCLQAADVVVYDRLVNPEIIEAARADAELISCGKSAGHHALTQEEINELLVRLGKEGKVVCRLKGGDPFVFGRGGEEAHELRQHGISFEVVPGVTSAIAAPAYAGIPVTHRGVATSFTVVTGHEDPTKPETQVDWTRLANVSDTLVILMGIGRLAPIVDGLIGGGRPPDTPVGMVRWGTRVEQETLVTTLQDAVADAAAVDMQPPATIVVGDVVSAREDLAWFDNRPLSGRRGLVTRTREQASELSALLQRYGAAPVEMPVIRIVPPETWEPLDDAIASASSHDWLVFTSANGVRMVRERLSELGLDIRALNGPRIAVIGPKTAVAAEEAGLKVSLCPEEYVAEALGEALKAEGLGGKRVLLLRAAEARSTFPDMARELGAEVADVPVYRTLPAENLEAAAVEMLEANEIDFVTFASSSGVRNFVCSLGREKAQAILDRVCVACIGPITAATASEFGVKTTVMPQAYTIEALVAAIADHFVSDDRRSVT